MSRIRSRWTAALAAATMVVLASPPAHAVDTLKVAKAGQDLVFATLEIGIQAGIWDSVGLKVVSIQTPGEAPMDMAMISGDIDIALAGGNSMAFRLKGVPDIAVATMLGPPYDFVLTVAANSPYKTVADLKGKAIGVTSAGSTTDYLVHELSRLQGWGPDGMQLVDLGGERPRLAALARGDIDGMVTTPEQGYDNEEHGCCRVLLVFGDQIKNFLAHTILARQDLVDKHPDQVERFLEGWFKTVAYMKNPANRDTCVKVVASTMDISTSAAGKAYDADVKGLSSDGVFDPKQVDETREAMPVFGVLDHVPDAKDLYTDRFVPVKIDN